MSAVCIPSIGTAQAVRGIVADSATGAPIAGAVATVIGRDGASIARRVTDETGRFAFASSPQGVELRVVRIGFRPVHVPLGPSADTTVSGVTIRMPRLPTFLAPAVVVADNDCPPRADTRAAFGLLEQVRAGLATVIAARESNPAKLTRLRYERFMDGTSDRIEHQRVRVDSGAGKEINSFATPVPPRNLIRDGFVRDSAGIPVFYAPDAEVIADPSFASGYCFVIEQPAPGRPTELGLRFRPANRRRGRVDIIGTLWTDTAARALRGIEFEFSGLPSDVQREHPGGAIGFREMPNGVVLIDAWHLRLIGIGADTVQLDRGSRIRPYPYAREVGGVVASASWADGRMWAANLGSAVVHAPDHPGVRGRGTVVHLVDTDYAAAIGSDGTAALDGLLPGPYVVEVTDPDLISLGIHLPANVRFTAVRGEASRLEVRLPMPADFVRAECLPGGINPELSPVRIIGRLLRADGRPAGDVHWEVSLTADVPWQVARESRSTDSTGAFFPCLKLLGTGFRDPDMASFRVRVWDSGDEPVVDRTVARTGKRTFVTLVLPR